MKVSICGVPHRVIECKDDFDADIHFGLIDYKACEIKINGDLVPEMQDSTLVHEMMHGILMHLGYEELAQDEKFVRVLGNEIYRSFSIRFERE